MTDSSGKESFFEQKDTVKHLAALRRIQAVLHDRVIGVADGYYPGCFIFGPAGRGKTREALETCTRHGVSPVYHSGHLTPIGLFELIETNADQVIVLDDVHVLFQSAIAQQMLLAALGKMDDAGVRNVIYRRQGMVRTVRFSGGLICISNVGLAEIGGSRAPFIAALLSRIHSLEYAPTTEQIIALLRETLKAGWQSPTGGVKLSGEECKQVLEFTLERCRQLEREPELRMIMDKALPDFAHWKQAETETHWQDLICSSLEERTIPPQRETRPYAGLTRAHNKEAEQALVLDLLRRHPTAAERIAEFTQRTGKDRRTYYRRVKELEQSGPLESYLPVDDEDDDE